MRPADRVGRLALAARLNDRGLRHKACGRYDKAIRCYERALEAIRRAPDPPHGALAAVYHNLGGIHYVVGAFSAAERAAREGIAARCRSAGDTAGLAADMIALAAIIDGQGRYDEGERLYLAGLAVLRLLPDTHPLEIAVALNGLGVQYAERGHYPAAIRLLARAARLKRMAPGVEKPSLLLTLRNLEIARRRMQ